MYNILYNNFFKTENDEKVFFIFFCIYIYFFLNEQHFLNINTVLMLFVLVGCCYYLSESVNNTIYYVCASHFKKYLTEGEIESERYFLTGYVNL